MTARRPPFRAGQRGRCAVATAADKGGLALRGQVGTVVVCADLAAPGDPEEVWDVAVIDDDVRPRMRVDHAPDDLARA